jgi:L-fuculose-phosphate aldolase
VNYFTQQQTKELLDLKKRLGYDDIRFYRGDNCDLCGNDAFGRGYSEPAACSCAVSAPAASKDGHAEGNGQAGAGPDLEALVQAITDQVMATLSKS